MEDRGIGLIKSTTNLLPKGKTYFLGIGINKYKHFNDLNNACNDVVVIRDVLVEKYGFELDKTTLLFDDDANRGQIVDTLYTYLRKATSDDRILIYYAGHGYMVDDSGFWIASDSQPERFGTYINNAEVRHIIGASKARHVLLMSDSCFSGSLIVRDIVLTP